jgi:NADH-quinone oxidoreductase subunit L
MNTVWIILFAPLIAAAVITLLTRHWKMLSAWLAIGSILLGFALSLQLLVGLQRHGAAGLSPAPLQWLVIEPWVRIEFGGMVDHLSVLMLLVVTGVGSAIFVYSVGYMRGEPGISRYFACMSLFTFSMLGIVLANNFIQMFIFWELVGVSSYLLIGYWYERPSAADAGKKAFIVNRIGDFGFLLGILLLWSHTGTFSFTELPSRIAEIPPGALALIGALIFCGAIGKSAQFPLHVWLPDAMEGPTPVSALIHAATMVAAGVYMLARVAWLIFPSELAMTVIMWIGAITAVMAAIIAIAQNDIKRILAYSTLSQLGYMVMAIGLGGDLAAMFHLTTHAFFKALLFLGAGSVIIALHHEQDIWKMGGLWRKMPITFWTFLIGTLALAGVWPLSGFYSKDEILFLALERNKFIFTLAVATAGLTAFYMGRELFVVFCGKPRDQHAYDHAHESPWVMTGPLIFLAILSVIGGWYSAVPQFLQPDYHPEPHALWLMIGLLAVPVLGFLLAANIYWKAEPSDEPVKSALGNAYTWIQNKFYFDEAYAWLVKYVQGAIAAICEWVDIWILQRLGIGGLSVGTGLLGRAVRLLQTGNIQSYAFLFGLGVTVIIYYVVVR